MEIFVQLIFCALFRGPQKRRRAFDAFSAHCPAFCERSLGQYAEFVMKTPGRSRPAGVHVHPVRQIVRKIFCKRKEALL